MVTEIVKSFLWGRIILRWSRLVGQKGGRVYLSIKILCIIMITLIYKKKFEYNKLIK